MTYLAIPIQVKSTVAAGKAITQAVNASAQLLELRLDYLNKPAPQAVETIVKAAKATGLPIIATCRPHWEGGQFQGNETDRLNLLQSAVNAGADYIDIELATLENHPQNFSPAKTIISSHDFESLPHDFIQRLDTIKQHNPDIPKIAYMAQRITDTFPALDALHKNPNAMVMAMGEPGLITRLLAKKLGAFLAFASLDESAATAPGQVSIKQMKKLFRWDHINSDTKVFGVIAHPVAHSKSPLIHNTAFDATGFNGLYLPMLVEPTQDQFNAFLDGLRQRKWLNVQGLSVTIPHKGHALDYVKANDGYLEPLAEKIGAVNTLIIDHTGDISGYNTDYSGAMDAITGTLNIERSDLKGLPAAVIGAGGVARAIVAGLTDAGVNVTIYNRTVEKATRLAQDFNCAAKGLDELKYLNAKLLINCTSIGMHPVIDATPVPADLIKKNMVIFDTVYNPAQTKLLQLAQLAGATTIDGVTMFTNQAAEQFKLFTQLTPPIDIMRQTIA